MKYIAKKSFGGVISMGKGDVREISDAAVISDLLKAGYIEAVKEVKETPKSKGRPRKRTE